MYTKLIKVYHSFNKWRNIFTNFLDDIGKTLENRKMTLGLNYSKWEFFYSFDSSQSTYSAFESQFYTSFNDFQIIKDRKWVWNYNMKKTAIGELKLENNWFFPLKISENDDTDFIFNMFRTFENFDVINDKVGIFYEITPLKWENIAFYLKSNIQFVIFKIWLFFKFFKYMFNFKIKKWRKRTWYDYFKKKLNKELFETKIYIVAQGINKEVAEGKIKWIFNNFLVFKNYPLNQFNLKIYKDFASIKSFRSLNAPTKKYILSSEEISSFLHFPKNPKNETALLKVTSRKLALPIWVPNFDYKILKNNEIIPKE